MKKIKLICSMLLLILLLSSVSQIYAIEKSKYHKVKLDKETYIIENTERFKDSKQPRIAIVLGGGGARGLAHIGVLKALKEEQIPIDMIVGTSMGAIIGTMYGSGVPIKQIEQIVTETTFSQMFELNFPSTKSLIRTTKVNHFLEKIAPTKRIENFPTSTAFLSYDLNRGTKYVHTKGKISEAIQSSYAIPFYFPVQEKDDFFLIDPGIVELTPAKTAKILGADIIISSTAIDKLPFDKYNNSIRALTRLIQLIQTENSSPITKKYSDIIINNQVGDYSFMDFQAASKLIEHGYNQTKKQMPEIKQLLEKKEISLEKYKTKKFIDISPTLKDVKYDRMILDSYRLKPLFYFGKDHSFFKQNLFKDDLLKSQYGLEFNKGRLNVSFLNNKQLENNLESQIKLKKITPNFDLINKIKLNSKQNSWEFTGKYYAQNYTFSLGKKGIEQQEFNLIKNEYDFSLNESRLQGETSLLITPEFDSYKTLTSHQGLFKLSSIWSLKPKVVFNNTDLMSSPTIYRGDEPKDSVKFQASLDYIYTHNFLHSLEFIQVLQVTDIKFYLFTDYQSSYLKSTAYGIGSKMNVKLLGVKPFHLGIYTVQDNKTQDTKIKLDLNFVF